MEKILRAGLIGLGNISGPHIKALLSCDNVKIQAVCDVDGDKLRAAREQTGARATDDWRDIALSPDIDAVHVLTPHDLHAEMSVSALSAGKHVLCEKPMATTLDDARRMIRAAEASGGGLGIVLQNRFNRSTQALLDIAKSGEAGKFVCARAEVAWRRTKDYYADAWHGKRAREGGGALINQAIHTLDLLSYIGGPIARVRGHVSTDLLSGAIDVEDNCHAVFEYRAGQTGVLHVTTNYGVDAPVFLEMVFERATYQLTAEKLFKIEDGLPVLIVRGETVEGEKSYWGAGHKAQIHAFYDEIRRGEPHRIDARSGFASLSFVEAIYQSDAEGGWAAVAEV